MKKKKIAEKLKAMDNTGQERDDIVYDPELLPTEIKPVEKVVHHYKIIDKKVFPLLKPKDRKARG